MQPHELTTFAVGNGSRAGKIVRQLKYKEGQQMTLQEVSNEGYPIGMPKFISQAELDKIMADRSIKWEWTVLVPHWIDQHEVDGTVIFTVVRRTEDGTSFGPVGTFAYLGHAEIGMKMLDLYALNGEYRLGLAWIQMLKERAIQPNPEAPFIGDLDLSGLKKPLPLIPEQFYDMVRAECLDRATKRSQVKTGEFKLSVPHEPIWLGALRRVLSGFKFGLKV